MRNLPKCKCGATISLWFSERLAKWTCPVCAEKDIRKLQTKVDSLRVQLRKLGHRPRC